MFTRFITKIYCCSFNKLLLQKEELEQKHLHLLQIVETEKTAKWQYTQQCEDLASEIKKLRAEVFVFFNFFCVCVCFELLLLHFFFDQQLYIFFIYSLLYYIY